jgi:hypothetical protein
MIGCAARAMIQVKAFVDSCRKRWQIRTRPAMLEQLAGEVGEACNKKQFEEKHKEHLAQNLGTMEVLTK